MAGISVGTGATVFGLLIPASSPRATFIATGSAILAFCIAALVAHIAGVFNEIDER